MVGNKTVALCMIVKDEENYLEQCLESVRSFVDEIVIVDTGSNDSTMDIAGRYTSKIYSFEWVNDFSAARNYSLQHANSDYVLVLDADEYFDSIPGFDKFLDLDFDYYVLKIKNQSDNGHAYYHQAIRLFKNNIGLRYFGKVHEHLNVQDFPGLGFQYISDLVIHHTGYSRDIYEKKGKAKRNLKLLLKEVRENESGYAHFNLAKQYKIMNGYDKALDEFKRAYYLSKDRVFLNELLYHMADCLRLLGRYGEGLKVAEDALGLFPEYTDLHYVRARLYHDLGALDKAKDIYRYCLELGDVTTATDTSIEGVGSYLAYYQLATLHLARFAYADAFETAYLAISVNKYFRPALHFYLELLNRYPVPNSMLYQNLKTIYDFSNKAELKFIIESLYFTRHRGLELFVDQKRISVDSSVLAVAKQYAGHYAEAEKLWESASHVNPNNLSDLVFLCLVRQDGRLLSQHSVDLNLGKKETREYSAIIRGSQSVDLKRIKDPVVTACRRLLECKESAVFQDVSRHFLSGSPDTQTELASLLADYGFFEESVDLLTAVIDKHKPYQVKKAIELLGDNYTRLGCAKEALQAYATYIDLSQDYWVLEKGRKLADLLGEESQSKLFASLMAKQTSFVSQ